MNYYKLVVAYDGTSFHGWQIQKNKPSIAQKMHDGFMAAFKVPVALRGASRTDTGVHALHQVVGIKTPLCLDVQTIATTWNKRLGPDIVIRQVTPTQIYFNPWNCVKEKVYYYHFFVNQPLPYVSRYGWFFRRPIDFDILQKCLDLFRGTHDFKFFSTKDHRATTIRTVTSATVSELNRFGCYRIAISGPSFLRYMVRRIVGASLEVASRKNIRLDFLERALKQGATKEILPTAPAHGLVLYKIVYSKGL